VICGISEERLARVKHYSGFPEKSINYVLKSSNVLPEEVSAIVITNRIYLKYLKRMFQRNKMKYAVESLFLKFWRRQKILGKYYPIGSYKD
jgi:predicted NodU family carbamoyl transferase